MVLPALVIYVIFHTLEKAANLAYMQKLSHIQRSRRSDQSSASQPGLKTFTEGEGEGEGEVEGEGEGESEGFARTDFTDAQWGVVVKAWSSDTIPFD